MLSLVLIVTAFLSVNSASKCSLDIEKLRCWCRDKAGQTLFRMKHEQSDNSTWFVTYDVTNEGCGPDDAKNVLPPSWVGREVLDETEPIINDPCNKTEIILDKEAEDAMINEGFVRIANSLYKLHKKGIFWDYARRTCNKEKAHLAIINSRAEAQYLAEYFLNHNSEIDEVENKDSVFVGFHDIFEEGEYLTIKGEPLADAGFNTWAPNKPDNNGKLEEGVPGHDCGGLFKTGTLIDLFCDSFYAFICEAEVRVYNKPRKANYSNGIFIGQEQDKAPPEGTSKRTKPGLGYQYYSGFGFYRYHTTQVVYDNARFWCQREGAYLAIINSNEEVDLIKSIVKRVPRKFIPGKYKKFAVFTGNPMNDSQSWDEAQSIAESCRSSEGQGPMEKEQCQVKHGFVCEKNLYE